MEKDKILESIKSLTKDDTFMSELFDSKDSKEFAKKLSSKGIELTAEEADQMFSGMKSEDGEISEGNLDTVTGGFCAAAAWGVAACAAFLYGYYKSRKCK